MNKLIQCTKCKAFHFAVTLEKAEAEVANFNQFYNDLSDESKAYYSGPSSIEHYKECIYCDNDKFMVATKDSPSGITLNPIIYEYKD